MPAKKRAMMIIAVMLTIGTIIGLIIFTGRIDYKTLYSGLSPEDAGAVIGKLKEKKVPYRVGGDGNTIMVPSSSVYEVRMQLASEGLPQNSTIGYEIFDRQNLGVTDFIQKVNFQRALQGELSRTIGKLTEIKNARVHLTLPEKVLFRDEQEKPRASVVLTLQPGKRLSEGQVQGIAHLVASSVEGMAADSVIIVDAHGKMLAGGKEKFRQADLTTSQQQLQSATEKNIEDKIVDLLGNVIGPDKITAKVAVNMDFTQMEQTVENYDPDSLAVRSEQRTSEKSAGKRPGASGIPGVASNTPDLKQTEGEGGGMRTNEYNKSDETINYEVSRVTKKIINQTGTVTRITAAVLVDGTYVNEKDKDGKEVRTYAPRRDEEMKKYEALVKRAVGYDDQRGDSVEIVNVQFQEYVSEPETTMNRILGQLNMQSLIKMLTTAFLIALFIVFALKPTLRMLSRTFEAAKPSELAGEKRRELGVAGDESEVPAESLLDKAVQQLGQKQTSLMQFAQKNPRLFAQYLKNWLQV